jgi:hypothetical protein
MSRLLKFTLLAPDIVEAIIDCREPSSFAISKLIKAIPDNWDEQHRKYGF